MVIVMPTVTPIQMSKPEGNLRRPPRLLQNGTQDSTVAFNVHVVLAQQLAAVGSLRSVVSFPSKHCGNVRQIAAICDGRAH
jgi:hypothetical protein